MTPGIATQSPQNAGSTPGSNGDFSINGQRTESNYFIVDGVAANVTAGPSKNTGYGVAGVVAATSALGTTQSLLSVDDLQEFRVESSSYSAEFGRSPGGQVTFVTRSGTDTYHGSAYEYFRNGWFDANDWFNDHADKPKQQLHQNDFGGTFGGPVWIPGLYKGKDKTFFFGSYEGLRLTEPFAATVQYVPDTYMRAQAPAAVYPLMNAFPEPNGIDYGSSTSPSLAQFLQGYSVPGEIDSSSFRIDETLTPKFSVFFRFADTPSSIDSRSYSILTSEQMNVQTYTLGTTNILSPASSNQFRLGYSRSQSLASSTMDSFGGAAPVDLGQALGNTAGVSGQNVEAFLYVRAAAAGTAELETPANNTKQHQWNLTDAIDLSHGAQQWKFGVDFRRISSIIDYAPTFIGGYFFTAGSVASNTAEAIYERNLSSQPTFDQLALYAQDNWRLSRRLTVSGGLRWELLPPPHNASSPQPYTVIGNAHDPSTLSLAPSGTAMWHTSWYSFAPRLGLAWQAHAAPDFETVIRTGGGVFFDTTNELAVDAFAAFGFTAEGIYYPAQIPLTRTQQNITVSLNPPYNNLYLFPSHLQNPYTLQWNVSIDQELALNNMATISYVGSAGRRLPATQELSLSSLNPLFGTVSVAADNVTSDYDALEARFQRSVRKGLTALVSYTWSHSIDYGSNASALPLTRGNSDFDVRNNFQAGATWDLPGLTTPSRLVTSVLTGWGIDGRFLARTGYPVTLQGNEVVDPTTGNEYFTNVDLVSDEPVYLYNSQYPGGRSLNPAAFAYPLGTSPGNAPRNFARGFGESQFNLAARRDFPLTERAHLYFRAEAFNVLNHPNFGYVDPYLTDATFGQATMMLNQSLGTVASQYQQGGPRSMQFSLRLAF